MTRPRHISKLLFVSILVFVELALESILLETHFLLVNLVSILVFVELALEFYAYLAGVGLIVLFQSLFSWNLLLNPGAFAQIYDYCVSILVFVELALEYCI